MDVDNSSLHRELHIYKTAAQLQQIIPCDQYYPRPYCSKFNSNIRFSFANCNNKWTIQLVLWYCSNLSSSHMLPNNRLANHMPTCKPHDWSHDPGLSWWITWPRQPSCYLFLLNITHTFFPKAKSNITKPLISTLMRVCPLTTSLQSRTLNEGIDFFFVYRGNVTTVSQSWY